MGDERQFPIPPDDEPELADSGIAPTQPVVKLPDEDRTSLYIDDVLDLEGRPIP